jgi:hypothetical protein
LSLHISAGQAMASGPRSKTNADTPPPPWYLLLRVITPALGIVILAWLVSKPPAWTADADRHVLPDGRHLAYYVRGDLNRSNVIFWQHATISCRLEVVRCAFFLGRTGGGGGVGEKSFASTSPCRDKQALCQAHLAA